MALRRCLAILGTNAPHCSAHDSHAAASARTAAASSGVADAPALAEEDAEEVVAEDRADSARRTLHSPLMTAYRMPSALVLSPPFPPPIAASTAPFSNRSLFLRKASAETPSIGGSGIGSPNAPKTSGVRKSFAICTSPSRSKSPSASAKTIGTLESPVRFAKAFHTHSADETRSDSATAVDGWRGARRGSAWVAAGAPMYAGTASAAVAVLPIGVEAGPYSNALQRSRETPVPQSSPSWRSTSDAKCIAFFCLAKNGAMDCS